ncbi:MAG: hypothetical protein ACRC30_03340 [Clostridium sp.]
MRKALKKKNGWKNKGYTLIEVVACMSISLTIILLIGKGLIEIENLTEMVYEKVYAKNIAKSVRLNIKGQLLDGDNVYYKTENKTLQIYKKLGNRKNPVKDEIYEKNENLYLKYFREENGVIKGYERVLAYDVRNFNIIQKENLIYIVFNVKGEENYVCI